MITKEFLVNNRKTVSVSKIRPLWEPWEEDETPRKKIPLGPGGIIKLHYVPCDLTF